MFANQELIVEAWDGLDPDLAAGVPANNVVQMLQKRKISSTARFWMALARIW